MAAQDAIFAGIFKGQGAVELLLQRGTRCDCYTADTRQPQWGHQACGGLGCIYDAGEPVRGLFRSRAGWNNRHASGEHDLMEAQLTLPVEHRIHFTDDRIRDRIRVVRAFADLEEDAVFYPQAEPTPFMFGIPPKQYAWRVKVQGLKNATRTLPQP